LASRRNIIAIIALLSASASQADELVDRADANGDGFVSLYELRAAYYADIEFNRRIEKSFAAYDTDGDGLISEAERRAAGALAATEPETERKDTPEPAAIPPTRSSGETAFATAAAATAANTSADETPAAARSATPAPARPAYTPPPARNVAAAPSTLPATVAEVAAMSAAGTASAPNPYANARTSNSRGGNPDTTTAAAMKSPAAPRLSRSESWILQIDTDNSGGASFNELLAGNDGNQFFSSSTFISADNDGNGELDAAELEVLIQSVERQRRYQQRGR